MATDFSTSPTLGVASRYVVVKSKALPCTSRETCFKKSVVRRLRLAKYFWQQISPLRPLGFGRNDEKNENKKQEKEGGAKRRPLSP